MDGVIAGRRTIGVQSDQEGCEAALVRARPAVVLRTWHNRQLGIGNCSKSLFLAFLREIWGGIGVAKRESGKLGAVFLIGNQSAPEDQPEPGDYVTHLSLHAPFPGRLLSSTQDYSRTRSEL